MIFADLIKQDGALARACELAYEFYMKGKCWHCKFEDGERAKGLVWCTKCGHNLGSEFGINPSIATSLDAWREDIWPMMDTCMTEAHWNALIDVAAKRRYIWMAEPIDHLEAALRAAEVKCNKCGGFGHTYRAPDEIKEENRDYGLCPDCINGRISLYTKLEREGGGMQIMLGNTQFNQVENRLGYKLSKEDEIIWNKYHSQKADLSDKESAFHVFDMPTCIVFKGDEAKHAILTMFTSDKIVKSIGEFQVMEATK